MLESKSQYDYVKDMLVARMSGYRRNSFKLRRLYEILSEKAADEAYVNFTFDEFYDMFVKECVNGNIPDHKFTIAEEGYLGSHKQVRYANVQVEFNCVPKRKKRTVSVAVNAEKTC